MLALGTPDQRNLYLQQRLQHGLCSQALHRGAGHPQPRACGPAGLQSAACLACSNSTLPSICAPMAVQLPRSEIALSCADAGVDWGAGGSSAQVCRMGCSVEQPPSLAARRDRYALFWPCPYRLMVSLHECSMTIDLPSRSPVDMYCIPSAVQYARSTRQLHSAIKVAHRCS